MKAELVKDANSIVFVPLLSAHSIVMISVYKDMQNVSHTQHDIRFARVYWRALVDAGYRASAAAR